MLSQILSQMSKAFSKKIFKTLFVQIVFLLLFSLLSSPFFTSAMSPFIFVASAADDARVLPQGRSRFSFIYGKVAAVKQTYNGDGKAQDLTAPFNFELSSANLKTFDSNISDLIDFLNNSGLHYNGSKRDNGYSGLSKNPADGPALGDALSRGFLKVDGEGSVQQYNFSYQYGVTDKLSVGFMAQIIKADINVSYSILGANTAADIYNSFVSKDPTILQSLRDALDFLRSADMETLQNVLASKGYDRFESTSQSGFGDLAIGGRYNYLNRETNTGKFINSCQLFVTVPTGRMSPPSEVTKINFGQGTWSAGLANISNYSPSSFITFSNGLYYTYQLPGHVLKRVKKDPNDFIPDASSEENVSVWLGDKYWTTLGAKLNATQSLSMDINYEWFWKRANRFQGTRTDRDYTYLSSDIFNTASYREMVQLAASYSTIPAFLRSSFPVPLDFSVSFNYPTQGKNALIAPYSVAELALYF